MKTVSLPSTSPSSRKKAQRFCVNQIALTKRGGPISVDDLALMLEIDLSLGFKADFRERLQKALDAVARQMAEQPDRPM
jgi:hypothetical protein